MKANQGLSARIAAPATLTQGEIDTWNRISSTAPGMSSPFLGYHYVRAVADAGMDVCVCVILKNGTVAGFLPYQFRNRISRWAKAAEPVGAEMTDYFGMVAEPDLRINAGMLLQLANLNYLGFSHLDESQLNLGLAGEQPRLGLRVRLDLETEDPLAALNTGGQKYFKDTERRYRQLTREVGAVGFEFDVQNNRHAVLEDLIQFKRSQYRRTNAPDALLATWKSRLLHILSEHRFETCRGVLSTLTAGDRWVASHFGLLGNGTLQYWLPVYNPEFSKYAPGRLLIHHVIQSAKGASIHMIDRGEGDTPSKRELANEEHQFYRGAWHNKSMSSRATRGIQSIKWRFGI